MGTVEGPVRAGARKRSGGWLRALAAAALLGWCAEAPGQWGGGGGGGPFPQRPSPFGGGGTGWRPGSVPAAAGRAGAPSGRGAGVRLEAEYDLPVMWVSGNGRGGCTRSKFRVRREAGGGPLRISTSDDTPGGSGRASRASLWQAAMTAAVLRNDPLTGVKIEYEYQGRVDGPSAGSVYCLAILSALDGREFPGDFAMTGTIMPDGTVGLVGGVARKLEGAKAAGIRRVCIPSFERFETEEDGTLEDLVAKARELGLELHPVSNVEEAYAVLHGLPAPSESRLTDAELYAEAPAQERALFEAILRNAAEASEAKELLQELLEDDDTQDLVRTTGNLMLDRFDIPDCGVALRAGMLHIALRQSAEALAFWQGTLRLAERMAEILGRYDLDAAEGHRRWKADIGENFRRLTLRIGEMENAWLDAHGREGPGGALRAQCVSVNWASEVRNFLARSEKEAPTQRELDGDGENEFLMAALLQEVHCARFGKYFENEDRGWQLVAATLPRREPARPVREMEGLFHAAQSALAEAMDEEYGEAAGVLAVGNFDWSLYLMKRHEAEQYHRDAAALAEKGDPGADFAMVMSAMAQADALAHGFMAKTLAGNEIGAEVDEEDGTLGYRNHPFVSYLLRTSRSQAVRALAECAKRNIPCPRVRHHLESGDYHRDDDSYDRFDVLREYWCAMLKAKALGMVY